MAIYPGENGGYGHGNGQPGGSDNPGPWDTSPYDPSEGNGNGGGGGPCPNSPPGYVLSELDVNGNWVGNVAGTQGECVDPSEAERRRNIPTSQATGNNDYKPPAGTGTGSGSPAGRPNYGKAPVFTPLPFNWSEQWQAPTLEQAQNSPGYQFRLSQGVKALQQSAAAKGGLFTGGTQKALVDYGTNLANQSYGDDFNRALQGYQTRFGTAKDIYDRQEQGAKDAFAPSFSEWLQNAHGADLGFSQNWLNFWRNNLSVQDIFGLQNS